MVSTVTILPFSLLQPHWPSRAVSGMIFGLRAFALAVWSWGALPPSICIAPPSSLQAPQAGPMGMVPAAGRGAEGFPITSRRTPPPHSSLSLSLASSYQKGPGSYRPCSCVGLTVPHSRMWEGEGSMSLFHSLLYLLFTEQSPDRQVLLEEQGP